MMNGWSVSKVDEGRMMMMHLKIEEPQVLFRIILPLVLTSSHF